MFWRAFKGLNSDPGVNLVPGESLDPALRISATIGLSCCPSLLDRILSGRKLSAGFSAACCRFSVLSRHLLLSIFHLDGILPASGSSNFPFTFIYSSDLNI